MIYEKMRKLYMRERERERFSEIARYWERDDKTLREIEI